MSDHGEQKARARLGGATRPAPAPAPDPLAELARVLRDAKPDAVVVVSVPTLACSDTRVVVPVSELQPAVEEEIDRVAGAAADAWDELKLEDAETRILELEDRVDVLEEALLPFAKAGLRSCITGDGSLADTYRDVGAAELRAAWTVMRGRGV